jgi:hypothetical protein
MHSLPAKPSTIDDVREIPTNGPWPTKAGGALTVPLAWTPSETAEFLRCDPAELQRIAVDIRGMRIFAINNVPQGRVGGGEFHRIRKEVIILTVGGVRVDCEDLYGKRKQVALSHRGRSIYLPPFILHSVTFDQPDSAITCVANTVFVPEDPRTHDSYPESEFRRMQRRCHTAASLERASI